MHTLSLKGEEILIIKISIKLTFVYKNILTSTFNIIYYLLVMNNVLIKSYFDSDLFGRLILIGLFLFSIYAWAIMALKWRMIKDIISKKTDLFKILNRSQNDLLASYQRGNPLPNSPFNNVYESICGELTNMLDLNVRSGKPKKLTSIQLNSLIELAECTISNQVIFMEKYLIVLATATSVSPLLGLLGTVWGILISFQRIALVGSTSISIMAPGMAEALVTTVAGLLVAMPALIGYNWITLRTQTVTTELENFSSRLLSYIQSIYCTSTAYDNEPAYSAKA